MAQIFLQDPVSYGDNMAPDLVASWGVIDSGDKTASTSTATKDPTGGYNAGTIAGDSTSGQHGISFSVTPPVALFEVEADVKVGNKNVVYISTGISNGTCYFALNTGLLGTIGSAAQVSMRKLGGGWYRCKVRAQGAGSAVTVQISPVDADGSTTMTSGDASTVNIYVYRPKVRAVYAHSDATKGPHPACGSDEGEQVISGWDGDYASPLNISRANASRTTNDRVALVQNITATGAVLTGIETVSAADGGTAATKSVLVGGKDGSGNQQDILVDSSGNVFINVLKVGGNTIDTSNGHVSSGTIRVVQADDQTVMVSKDNSSNATGNRLWVTSDIDKIGGTSIPSAGDAAISKGMPIHVSDGTYSRRTYGDSNGVQYVQPYTIPSYEDSVNSWANTRDRSHYSACGADVATVTVDGTTEGAADEIVPSTNVSTYRGFTLWVENLGATALNHVYVYASRDGTNWVCVDAIKNALETACDTLAATSNGICFSVTSNPGWQYVKCTATVAAGSTTATGALSYQM